MPTTDQPAHRRISCPQPAAKPAAKRPAQPPPALFHKPEGNLGPLSNWWVQSFSDEGTVYTSVEQYLMQQKMLTFNQRELAAKIMDEDDPKAIKALGRTRFHNFDDEIWGEKRPMILMHGVWLKFSQNDDLADIGAPAQPQSGKPRATQSTVSACTQMPPTRIRPATGRAGLRTCWEER